VSTILGLRKAYHEDLCQKVLGLRKGTHVFTNADKDSPASVVIARGIAERLSSQFCSSPPGAQGSGTLFAACTRRYLQESFGQLRRLRPGRWTFSTSQAASGIAAYDQYRHLAELAAVLEEHPNLKAALGGDYFITPDILVAREPLPDAEINAGFEKPLVVAAEPAAAHTPLRAQNHEDPLAPSLLLHASISCKWTMRSDRSQNTRTEALNLLRHRKGNTPHIVVVTAEPLPSRIASIAMGTGDIDCTYHIALPELRDTLQANSKLSEALDLIELLEGGRRLRDISDLPFDLAV
jgi:hypothetical protein